MAIVNFSIMIWLPLGVCVHCSATTKAFFAVPQLLHHNSQPSQSAPTAPSFFNPASVAKKLPAFAIHSSPNDNDSSGRGGPPVEIVAVLVSLFFVAVVVLLGDQLFATPPVSPTAIVDADALLRDEFRQVPSSVEF